MKIPFRRLSALACLSLALLTFPHTASSEDAPSGSSFVDRFAPLQEGRWRASHGWANGDHQGCVFSSRNVKLLADRIELVLDKVEAGKRPFACAELQSKSKYFYGTYEVRVRSAAGPGLVTAFFTYAGSGKSDAQHHEIDFEFLGKTPRSVQLNYYASGQGGHERHIPLGFDASQDFNTYAFEWLPAKLRWYVNGRLVREVLKEDGKPFPDQPSGIFLSLWSGAGSAMDSWLESFKYPGKPILAAYDYVSFTAAGEPCQFPESIVCQKEPQKFGRRKPFRRHVER